ncbi:hypothetical protein EH223_06805 [candidate division KSB1 bacterium]|nr:hypothetical protein [candidate division KSB1 bacterium]RQW04767.1 MAG: hypothetical protein EH223_06805 [candidate division KSB1 bacterium]
MLEKLANVEPVVFFIALFVATFLVAWLLTLVWSKGKALAESTREKAPAKKSMGFLSTLFVFLIVVLVLLVLAVTRFYTAFTSHQLVAIVECYPTREYGGNAFELVLTRVVDGKHKASESYIIRGEDWSLGGDILEWQSFMNVVGLKSMYRLTRLQGRYDEAEEEMTENITAYALVDEEKSQFWETLYNLAVKTPIIKSAHQNFVATHPFFGDYFEVYVTPTGYTMERFEGKR